MAVSVTCPVCSAQLSLDRPQVNDRITCTYCGRRLTISPSKLAKSLRSPPDMPARIGRFEIRGQIGTGAFGTVWRGFDPQLERELAVKVPRQGTLVTSRQIERFFREAKAAARLRHQHIVPIFDAGFDGTHHYIASALIPGRGLSEIIEEGPIAFGTAARIGSQIAAALACAHQQGVVHRDVKPGNVLIDNSGHAQLVDFGLARCTDDAARLTEEGALLGTPAYMAPEQARGAAEASSMSDQFSLGVTLYEMLAGRPPFVGPPEVVLYHLLNSVPPALRLLRPDTPPGLESICQVAMAKGEADRYRSCRDLAEDLAMWEAGQKPRGRVDERPGVQWRSRPRLGTSRKAR